MKNIRVLIVEDEPIIAADLEDRLVEMGYVVVRQCSSGEEAIQYMPKGDIDLVLMDIQLEGALDGIQTAQKLLEISPIRLIYLTSNVDEATFQRAKQTQPDAFLSKPFRGKDLIHAIDLAFSRDVPPAAPSNEKSAALQFDDRIFIKVKDQMQRVFLSDILWFEADDYYCKMVTKEKSYLITHTLKQMEESLSANPNFLRGHRSYLINLSQIEVIGDTYVSINNTHIPLNKNSKEEITNRLQKI